MRARNGQVLFTYHFYFMRHYEVTLLIDPVLSGEEVKATAQKFVDLLTNEGVATIIHIDEMGLRPLAYQINRRQSGIYYCIEFAMATGEFINKLELNIRRDERVMRFLTIALDKYGVKYNEDKRAGKIGKAKPPKKASERGEGQQPVPTPTGLVDPVALKDPELAKLIDEEVI